jgi:aminoglycoside 6'-N-acetyltransferase I
MVTGGYPWSGRHPLREARPHGSLPYCALHEDQGVTTEQAAGSPRTVLREAAHDDLPTLVALARAFYDEDGFTTSTAMLEENFGALLDSSGARVVLVVIDGTPRAFALTTTAFTLESGTIAELQDIYVRPEYRRRGIAALLIADALEWARARSAVSLELVVAPNGHDVSHLFRYYEARGFVDEGRRILSRPL